MNPSKGQVTIGDHLSLIRKQQHGNNGLVNYMRLSRIFTLCECDKRVIEIQYQLSYLVPIETSYNPMNSLRNVLHWKGILTFLIDMYAFS